MLELGWRLVARGEWVPYGMPMSAGGRSPGGLMALVVALPLAVWRDFRAPAFLTLVLHAGAFLLFVRTVRPALSTAGLWLLLPLLWLNPWRMYFSAHAWNANFMFVFAVLHLATAQRMRVRRRLGVTFLHVLLIGLAVQIHTSVVTLAIVSALLYARGMLRVHWGGVALAVALTLATLVPWALVVQHEPGVAPGSVGFFLRGLVFVAPVLRGFLYWVRLSSLSVPVRMVEFDFAPVWGSDANLVLLPLALVLGGLAQLTIVPSLWANWRFIRQRWLHWRLRGWHRQPPERPRAWLRGYVALALVAALVSFAISPVTIMFWQEFVVLPAAVLVLVMPTEALLRTRHRARVRGAIAAWCVLLVPLLGFEAVAARAYRCGGWEAGPRDAMAVDLGVPTGCRRRVPE